MNRNALLKKPNSSGIESSIIDFEINEYINSELPKLKESIQNFENDINDEELEK